MRIALIHALPDSVAPTAKAFAELWPEAELANLLDDSLSRDVAADGAITPAMVSRFVTLARYVAGNGARAILFTCSAFGPAIEAARAAVAPLPVLKPTEAMLEESARYRRVGLIASFGPTLDSLPAEFPEAVAVVPALDGGALAALQAGDPAGHDAAAVASARRLAAEGVEAIVLAQFSLARAAGPVAEATGLPVLTSPGSAVRKLKRLLAA
jgi:Asp/Glu/hydantoin racemase